MPTRVWYRWTKFPSVNMHRSIFSISLAALHQSLINFDTRPKNYPIFGLLKRAQMLKQYLSRLFTGDEMWHGYQETEEISSWCERTSSERIYKALDKVHPAPPWTNFPMEPGNNTIRSKQIRPTLPHEGIPLGWNFIYNSITFYGLVFCSEVLEGYILFMVEMGDNESQRNSGMQGTVFFSLQGLHILLSSLIVVPY